jgi:hypothetical protein
MPACAQSRSCRPCRGTRASRPLSVLGAWNAGPLDKLGMNGIEPIWIDLLVPANDQNHWGPVLAGRFSVRCSGSSLRCRARDSCETLRNSGFVIVVRTGSPQHADREPGCLPRASVPPPISNTALGPQLFPHRRVRNRGHRPCVVRNHVSNAPQRGCNICNRCNTPATRVQRMQRGAAFRVSARFPLRAGMFNSGTTSALRSGPLSQSRIRPGSQVTSR